MIRDGEYMKIPYVNRGLRSEYESDVRSTEHYFNSSENKAWKLLRLYEILTHDLCDTGAVLYQLR